ncbi:polysaccharide lyase 6 family protein [Phytoactinopolyspora limicola]|uniref:polysaccharide lyase 6 family protein n=1 Tax=Phytoactinopolyspora limicola TaxID=2715536 RepID=UPI0014075A84|nr:polysaccharide lyase 6 family protein [Phytoactinopolyspora limicola]
MTNPGNGLTRRAMLAGAGALAIGGSGVPAAAVPAPRRTAQDYYVTTVAQLDAALAAAAPGDSIVVQDRTWTDLHIVIGDGANHGAPGAPITLRAETRGGVTLSGASYINLARDHWVIDGLVFRDGYLPSGDRGVIYFGLPLTGGGHAQAHHCELTQVTIEDYNPTNPAVQYNWVRMMGTNNTVSYCYFSGKNHYLDLLAAHWAKDPATVPTNHWIHHNYFANIPDGGGNGYGAVTPVQGGSPQESDFNVVEDNLFYRCDGESEIISVKSSHNIVRRNTFVECVGYISLRLGNNNDVSGNYFFASGVGTSPTYPGGIPLGESGGVRVTGEGHRIYNNYIDGVSGSGFYVHNGNSSYPPVKDVEIVHNTVVDTGHSGIRIGTVLSSGNTPPEDLVIANNIVYSQSGVSLTYDTEPTSVSYQGDIMYGAPIDVSPVPAGIQQVDPQLTPVAGNYPVYQPGAGSPAIDAAAGNFGYVDDDVAGRGRPAGAGNDVGAHESSVDPVVYPPLTGADVGPGYL